MDQDHLLAQVQSKLSQGQSLSSNDWNELTSLGRNELPWLTRSFVDHCSSSQEVLVRYVGMVQDMMDPEYFVGEGRQDEELSERHPLLVVPVPFVSEWHSFGRPSTMEPISTPAVRIPASPPESITRKRDRECEEVPETLQARHKTQSPSHPSCDTPSSILPISESDWWPAGTLGSNPEECPVLAKLHYDQYPTQERLRLNDLVELIGVLSIDPWEASWAEFDENPIPPPSRLPRLNVLSFCKIDLDTTASPEAIKDPLHVWTNHNGWPSSLDSTLAEVLFLTLVGKAERRHEEMQRGPQQALGCASLQLTSSNSQQLFQHLSSILPNICPVVAAMDGFLNMCDSPSKESGRLVPTPWQLPRGATLLLHVPHAPSAELRHLLEELCTQHRLSYTFEGGMRLAFDADYRIILVTSPIVTLSCTMTLKVDDVMMDCDGSPNEMRSALAYARSLPSIALPATVMEQAQHDFLQRRAEARTGNQRLPGENCFHRWLTLTRLYARARGLAEATTAEWEAALQLDDKIHKGE